MKLENGAPAFCNTCPNRGTCVGELSSDILPTETKMNSRSLYYKFRLQDKVHGRSEELEPLEGSWFNGMHEQTKHLEMAGDILLQRIAACSGQNATGKCVIVDKYGISEAVLNQLNPDPQA